MEKFDLVKHWEKFMNNKLVVNCRTQELADEFFIFCDSKNLKWRADNESLLVQGNLFYRLNEETCYTYDNGTDKCKGIHYSDIDWFKNKNIDIVEFQGL